MELPAQARRLRRSRTALWLKPLAAGLITLFSCARGGNGHAGESVSVLRLIAVILAATWPFDVLYVWVLTRPIRRSP